MPFDPKREPCFTCGREADECVCGFAPDISIDDPLISEDEQWDDEEIENPEQENYQ